MIDVGLDTSQLMFGVELEQMGGGHEEDSTWETCEECEGSGQVFGVAEVEDEDSWTGEWHEGDPGEWEECLDCYGNGGFDREPDSDLWGFASRALTVMRDMGLTDFDHLHYYHCDCEQCAPFRRDPLLAAQEDCTVAIEWVSRAMRSPNNLNRIIAGHEAVMEATDWRPDGYESAGNHIHIGLPVALRGTGESEVAFGAAAAMVVAKDWDRLADGGCGQIRGYNHKGQMRRAGNLKGHGPWETYGGSFLASKKGGRTIEFRMWNTPRNAWRIAAHAGLSMAITRWAIDFALERQDRDVLIEEATEVAKDTSLLEVTNEWLPERWPHRAEIIDLVTASGQ